jgi:putative ABC transport system ATP-binding protein
MDYLIETRELSKTFTTDEVETTALDQVNLAVRSGEFAAIMGPSGCGKSTLLNIIGLLDAPTVGAYLFHGRDISNYNERQRARLRKGAIGFVFQSFNLIDELTVFENIALPLIYLDRAAQERKSRVEEVMDKMNIIHRRNHFPQQLSGGQQQRTAIARAVVSKPALILADEPTGNLDSANGKEVMDMLNDLNESGTTILMVTHSPHDASYAKRTINLFDGRIVTEQIREVFHV